MKIGIATYFWDDNPGLYFQALATYNELKAQIPDAHIEIINAMHWNHPWRPSYRPSMFVSSVIKRVKYMKARKMLPLSQPALLSTSRDEITDYINSQNYDLIVIGADVSLKPLPKILNDQLPYHWIDKKVKARKIMLASSADITRIDQLSSKQIAKMKEVLSDFSYIGIRDSMTENLMADLGYKEKVCRVPDPAFAYPIKKLDNVQLEKIRQQSSKKTCVISLSSTAFTTELVKQLEKNYTIVCNMFPWSGKKTLKYIGPFEWANIFRYVDLVVTCSFHETIFSFKSGIPAFAVDYNPKRIDTENQQSKTLSLLSDMRLPNHHLSPFFESDAQKCFQQIQEGTAVFNPNDALRQVETFSVMYKTAVSKAVKTTN